MATPSNRSLKVSILRPAEVNDHLAARWRQIQSATEVLQSPFLSPHFARLVGAARKDTRIAVVEDEHRIRAFFAFQRSKLGNGRPVGMALSDRQALIAEPGFQVDLRSLMRQCSLSTLVFDHLLPGQSAFDELLASTHRSPTVNLQPVRDSQSLSDSILERRKEKRLARAAQTLERNVGPMSFTFDDRDPKALTTLIQWKAQQYRRTGLVDSFRIPWFHETVESVFHIRHTDCSGLLSTMRLGDRLVAGHLGIRSSKLLHHWLPAYDVEFANYSHPGPGIVSLWQILRHAPGAGIDCLDFGRGTESYKLWFANGFYSVGEGRIEVPSMASALHRFRLASEKILLSAPGPLNAPARRLVNSAKMWTHRL